MKKFLRMLCLLLMIFCVAGCDSKETISSEDVETILGSSDVRYAERYQMISISEAGVISDDMNEGLVYLTPVDDTKKLVFCYLPDCRHDTIISDGEESKCMAAHYGNVTRTAYYGGILYFFVMEGLEKHRIYKMETNGAKRELFAELPFSFNIGYACVFCEDKMYYTAQILHKDEITGEISYGYRVVEVDLTDATYRFITEEKEELITIVNLSGNTLYIRKTETASGGIPFVTVVDMNTLEETIIITTDEWINGNRYIDAYDEDSYFYYDAMTYEIGIKNVDGNVEKVLLRGSEGEHFSGADPSCDGLFYERIFDYEGEPAGAYFMDLVTGSITNITEEKEKYGLEGYDGYYDVFVAREYVESERSMKWSIWSKEKVLAEASLRETAVAQ